MKNLLIFENLVWVVLQLSNHVTCLHTSYFVCWMRVSWGRVLWSVTQTWYFYCFRVAVEALKSFLLCSKCEHVAEILLQCTHIDGGDSLVSFIEMVPALTK